LWLWWYVWSALTERRKGPMGVFPQASAHGAVVSRTTTWLDTFFFVPVAWILEQCPVWQATRSLCTSKWLFSEEFKAVDEERPPRIEHYWCMHYCCGGSVLPKEV
jgi:hypothetical protein